MNVNFDELTKIQGTIKANKEKFDTVLTKIEQTNAKIAKAWQDEASSKYSTKIQEQAKTMKELSKTIGEITVFLNNVTTAYKKAIEANTLK